MDITSQDSTYLFIDAGHLRNLGKTQIEDHFGEFEFDLSHTKQSLEALKCFYYDSLPGKPRSSESEDMFATRKQKAQERVEKIRRYEGFHVRLGSVSGKDRKERQKQVDVLLAVDMLTHAFRNNMTHAVLVTGDLDFKPVVDALVYAGVYVTLRYGEEITSSELVASADRAEPISTIELTSWARTTGGENFAPSHAAARKGQKHDSWKVTFDEDRTVTIFETPDGGSYGEVFNHRSGLPLPYYWGHQPPEKLRVYLEKLYPRIIKA